jgi:hypothetical protein
VRVLGEVEKGDGERGVGGGGGGWVRGIWEVTRGKDYNKIVDETRGEMVEWKGEGDKRGGGF